MYSSSPVWTLAIQLPPTSAYWKSERDRNGPKTLPFTHRLVSEVSSLSSVASSVRVALTAQTLPSSLTHDWSR